MECCWYHLLFLVGNVVLYNTGINTCFTLMGLLYCNLQTTVFSLFFFYRLVTILGGLTPKKEEVSTLYVLYHRI